MTSKTNFFGAAAAAIALSAATVSASPAQAFDITPGSILSFVGSVKVAPNINNPSQLTFKSASGTANKITIASDSTGSFAGLGGTTAAIKALPLLPIGGNFYKGGAIANFITGIGPNAISFDLTEFIFNKANADAKFSGIFRTATSSILAENGTFTSQLNESKNITRKISSFSADVQAIPTPALLPGLIGLGMGVLRKRKKEMAEATAEA
ncbi:PTPA-CTERM sorting domain-containing protein [Phormidesmis priestleyi]